MSRKVLFVATVLRGHVLVFHLPYMRWFQQQGYEVHLCCRNDTGEENVTVPYCDRYFDLPFERSPFSGNNLKVYRQLKAIIDENEYTIVHCHTPVGGMLGRLCSRKARKRGTRVIYTAHGFHFFTGAPLKNWLMFYPAERLLSRWTDLLITINQEDERRAKRFAAAQVALVGGVGVDLSRFNPPADRREMRDALGIAQDAQVLITVGEHSRRKNHQALLRAAAKLPDVQVLLCGWGDGYDELVALADELKISERVHFLGFRKDVPSVLAAADVFVFPTLHEGLPVSLMEAMAAGLPCVVSNVRGNADLIEPGEGGFLREPMDIDGMAADIQQLLMDPALCSRMGRYNQAAVEPYALPAVLEQMAALYQQQLREDR